MPAPARHRKIDPDTGDYLLSEGAPEADTAAASWVYLALATRKGSIPLLPEWGSRFHEIRKLTDNAPRLAEQFAVEAIEPLTSTNVIRKLATSAKIDGSTLRIEVSYTDSSGNRQTVPYTHRL